MTERRPLAFPDPPLEDGVVRLRPLRLDDAPAWAQAFRDDPDLGRLLGEEVDPDEDEIRRRIVERDPPAREEGRGIVFAIESVADGALLGDALLFSIDWKNQRAEVGFWLRREARGHGYGRRALELILGWGFSSLGLARIHLMTLPDNAATRALARAAGFTEEGTLREYNFERGRRVSLVLYSLLAREWSTRDAPPSTSPG